MELKKECTLSDIWQCSTSFGFFFQSQFFTMTFYLLLHFFSMPEQLNFFFLVLKAEKTGSPTMQAIFFEISGKLAKIAI